MCSRGVKKSSFGPFCGFGSCKALIWRVKKKTPTRLSNWLSSTIHISAWTWGCTATRTHSLQPLLKTRHWVLLCGDRQVSGSDSVLLGWFSHCLLSQTGKKTKLDRNILLTHISKTFFSLLKWLWWLGPVFYYRVMCFMSLMAEMKRVDVHYA